MELIVIAKPKSVIVAAPLLGLDSDDLIIDVDKKNNVISINTDLTEASKSLSDQLGLDFTYKASATLDNRYSVSNILNKTLANGILTITFGMSSEFKTVSL